MSSVAQVSRLPSRSIWIPPREVPTFTLRAAIPERTPIPTPSPLARSAALCTAIAASAARCEASSTGSSPNAAMTPVGLISSIRPPNVRIFSTRVSIPRLGLNAGSTSAGRISALRRNASFRPSHRTAKDAPVSIAAVPAAGSRGVAGAGGGSWTGAGRSGPGCPLPRRSLRSLPRQTVLLHAIAERVPGDAEPSGRARDVAARLAQGLHEVGSLDGSQGIGERGPLVGLRRGPRVGRGGRRGNGRQAEMLDGHHRHLGQERDPLHHVRELAHVPGPRIGEQGSPRLRREAARGHAVLGARPIEEVGREAEHVLAALPERRDGEHHHGEPVVEVLAERPGLSRPGQVLVGGRQDPHVHGLAPGAAQPADGPVFERFQKLRLEGLGQESDLIQEDRAVVRRLEQPGLRVTRVGEGAPLVAEELGLEQGARGWPRS